MLKIRLQRVGRKNDPSFRVVVTESTNAAKKSGRFAEVLGSYDARQGEPQLKADRIKHWLGIGAQVSDTVHNLLLKQGIVTGKTRNPLPKKVAIKKAEEAKAPEPAVEAPEPAAEVSEPVAEAPQEEPVA